MLVLNFNSDWSFRRLNCGEGWAKASVPHDAMILEKRTPESSGGANIGWFECFDYEYKKTFPCPEEYSDKTVFFEFEGVYRNAEVYINGQLAANRPYGYTGFTVYANEYLRFGEWNEIRVVARGAEQPNSRWYSGVGIYRPVTMYIAEKRHILFNGLKIRTVSIDPAVVEVSVETSDDGTVDLEIYAGGEIVARGTVTTENRKAVKRLAVYGAKLWSPESPNLYLLAAKFAGDAATARFGIRTIACTPAEGFTLNGKRVVLRGACIHHDNGILGARCFPEAEERKIRILKENGYNAVRSAHNPCSKALLDACDKLGMLVMDEYCDMWYVHKTKYDYADNLLEWFERDIRDMIEKDFNHPSVIIYSLGNEVAETSEKKGVELFEKMYSVCKKYDEERLVTVCVNMFFNFLYRLGLGVYSDKKAEKAPKKKVGSEFFNWLAGIFGAKFMKLMAKLYFCDIFSRKCFAKADIAGYNYGIMRYKHDLKKYPRRIILGSETFCADAFAFTKLAESNNAVIGDFVWSGIDYLGEVGVGSWEYRDYAPSFSHGSGWITAGSGRINLIGTPLGEALYTKTAFGLEEKPQIAVIPVNHTDDKHSPSAWKFSNALPSWSWNGLDGKKAKVEVYALAPRVRLYVNGKKVGEKKFRKNCRFKFNVKYYGGEITAVSLDWSGNELARNSLKTAGDETVLSVVPEKIRVKRGELCFVRLRYTDLSGEVKPLKDGLLDVDVKGGELIAVGSARPFNELSFTGSVTNVYFGEALAVVRADGEKVEVSATDGIYKGFAEITAV